MPSPRILCVHGVGDHHSSDAWESHWRTAIDRGIAEWDPGTASECHYLMYDDIFQDYPVDPLTYTEAFFRLSSSGVGVAVEGVVDRIGAAADRIGDAVGGAVTGVFTGIGDFFRRPRGLEDVPAKVRWTAGMVGQWAAHERLRSDCRKRVAKAVRDVQPDVVLAHSLGTLVCYDTFIRDAALLEGRTFVSLGTQIATPFVRGTFGGRLVPLRQVKHWYQLFNPYDRMFTEPVVLAADNFTRVYTAFQDGSLNHDAARYVAHANTIDTLWRDVAAPRGRGLAATVRELEATGRRAGGTARGRGGRAGRTIDRRALLVAINEYPDPAKRLDGCVNDAFLVSAALQESGFEPEHIRTVFDDRATTAGILERLHWLLEDTRPGDQRVLFYSGHGGQIPTYGRNQEVDHLQECLVPYDFDWSPRRAITDDQFVNLYSQLPYECQFVAILDCCHSGGLTPPSENPGGNGNGRRGRSTGTNRPGRGDGAAGRDDSSPAAAAFSGRAGTAKVRGIAPPDDVRHRALKWDPELDMWVPRPLREATPDQSILRGERRGAFVGTSGANYRFGRAIPLRRLGKTEKEKLQDELGHKGPFVPVVFQACQEHEFAFEYRHGVTSYGAFTYSLYHLLRDARRDGKPLTFRQLAEQTSHRLTSRLGYDQRPCLFGPTEVISKHVPWAVRGTAGAKTG